MRKFVSCAAAVLMLSSLAGCAGSTPSSTPSAASSSSMSPTATPQSAPSTTPLATVISENGLGTLVLGKPVPTGVTVPGVSYDAEYCKEVSDSRGEPFDPTAPWSGAWTASDATDGFRILTTDGLQHGSIAAVTIDDWSLDSPSKYGTAAGIHAGSSTTRELLAAYPDFDVTITGDLTDVYAIKGSNGYLAFEVTPHASAGYWQADQLDRVLSIRATTSEPGPIAGTDANSPCAL